METVESQQSPFLDVPPSDWIAANAHAFAIFDRFPVNPGHTLVVTRRLVPTWFDATPDEQTALMCLVNVAKVHLDSRLNPQPDGYNIGFNSGDANPLHIDDPAAMSLEIEKGKIRQRQVHAKLGKWLLFTEARNIHYLVLCCQRVLRHH